MQSAPEGPRSAPSSTRNEGASEQQLELAEVVRDGQRLLALEHGWSEPFAADALERLPCAGTLRLRCDDCGSSKSLEFRCVGRCAQRCEHGERAAVSLAGVIPRVPVRHWTLTLPPRLRVRLAQSPHIVALVARAFVRELFRWLPLRLGLPPGIAAYGGAASLVHGLGDALNSNVHLHALVLDGAYVVGKDGEPTFHPLVREPTASEVHALVQRVDQRIRRLVPRGPPGDPSRDRLVRASVAHRVATGPRAGAVVRRVRVLDDAAPEKPKTGVGAERDGTRVHAMPRIDAESREAVLRLSRYLVRPPIDRSRLSVQPDGRIRYRLAAPWSDGTTHVEFAPRELAERLLAAGHGGVVHRVAYHGALAPGAAAKWRTKPIQLWLTGAEPTARQPLQRERRDKRTRRTDPTSCPRCGGRLRVFAVEESADVAAFGEVASAS